MTTTPQHSTDEVPRPDAVNEAVVPDEVQALNYDSQTDLALPEPAQGDPDAAITPYTGSVVEEPPAAGYDIDRDVAL